MKFSNENHYDGDCSLAKFFMSLSSWTFSRISLDKLPSGYVENAHFGPRVAKYDWFPLLVKFPLLFLLLILAAVTAVLLLFWFCCKVQGLQKYRGRKYRCWHCLITLLLLLLLLPLATGLYMTFRTNYLLRRNKETVKGYGDAKNSTVQNLERNEVERNLDTREREYKSNSVTAADTIKKSISEFLTEWQQTLARNEDKKLQTLKYLYNNRESYRPAVQALRDFALKLVILGLEMEDLLRTVYRETIIFLHTNANSTSLKDFDMPQAEKINVWHLHSVYIKFEYLLEYLEHLLAANENILNIQKSLAELTSNENEDKMLFEAQKLRNIPRQTRDSSTATGSITIPKLILYLAMAVFFLSAALIYILLMALGFGILRHYEEANSLLKFFFFINVLTIGTLAILSVLHFLLSMVLHMGICHKNAFLTYRSADSRLVLPPQCRPVIVTGERSSLNYGKIDNDVFREHFFNKFERIIPRNIFSNFTTGSSQPNLKDLLLPKTGFEQDIGGFLTEGDSARVKSYIKGRKEDGTKETNIFLCKFNSIPNVVKNDLYEKRFMPIVKELHETLKKLETRAVVDGFAEFMTVLKNAKSELDVFDEFYTLSRANLLITLNDKFENNSPKFAKNLPKEVSNCPIKYEQSERTASLTPVPRDADQYTKCGCLEDWLMLYAIGSALLVVTLSLTMILGMLLYKFYKRGPPILAGAQTNFLYNEHAPRGTAPSAPPFQQALDTASTSMAQDKNCIVDMKYDQPTSVPNSRGPLGGATPGMGTPLINTVNFIPPGMGPFGYQPGAPVASTQQQMHAGNQYRNDGVILPLHSQSRTQMGCAGSSGATEAQLVGGGTTKDKTVTVMVFQGPKDRQPVVTYPAPPRMGRK